MSRALLLLMFATTTLFAQQFQMKQYKVANGLPSDVVKAVEQDSLGFIWIATDDGLVKFDGLRFITYKEALHSQYAKGFLKTKKGKLLLFGDLDLIQIDNFIDTVIFTSVRQGARNPTDTMLYFPKSLYEDRYENIWVAEPQSVAQLSGKKLRRFDFDLSDRSPQFLRSFSFFEDRMNNLFTVSYFGNVYIFNQTDSGFSKQEIIFPTDVNEIKKIGNTLWIAGRDGLYSSNLLAEGGYSKPQKIFSLINPYDFEQLDNDHFIIGSSLKNQTIADLKNRIIRDVGYSVNNVNDVFISNQNDVWLSSSEGLILLQKNSFLNVGINEEFVESITEDVLTQSIYFCTREELYKVQVTPTGVSSSELISRIPRGYFQALVFNDQSLWASNAFSLFQYQKNKLVRKWDLQHEGMFIHDIILDSKNNLWLAQAGNEAALCLTPNLELKRYKILLSEEGIINSVREGKDGMYVTSNGVKSYLFFKSNADSVFKNASLPVKFKVTGDFSITELVSIDSILWMASSEGLLRYDFKTIERVNLGGKYTLLSVKSVEFLQPDQFLFTNAMGMFRYEISTGNFWLYDEGNGIASNTITARGIFVGNDKRVWVGTSKGLSYSTQSILEEQKTQSPFFVEVNVNGVSRKFTNGISIPYGSFLNVLVSSISFPENHAAIQYRIVKSDSSWRAVENNVLSFSELEEGNYDIEIRARKHGGYSWSNTRTLFIEVQNPFWKEFWFFIFIALTAATIAYLSFTIAGYFNKRRRHELEELVDLRTKELQKTNEELTIRNSELDRFVYSASHDLSAPLKSMLGLVNVARKENPGEQMIPYLDMIEKSAKRLEAFIKDVIIYSRNTRTPVETTEIDFEALVKTLLADHQYATNYSEIEYSISAQLNSKMVTDEMRLKIILNNLISNAIKFHFSSDGRKPFIDIRASENEGNYVLEVEDNGRGIEEEMLGKIFHMFFRATDSVQGSGLGLYILKETTAKLGGEVSVRSALDKGTTFTILLPKGGLQK